MIQLLNGWNGVKISQYSPFHITQIFRGNLVVLLDCILRSKQAPKDDTYLASEMVEAFIRFFIVYLKHLQDLIPYVSHSTLCKRQYSEARKLSTELFYSNAKVAFCECHPELFDMFGKLFRRQNYYDSNRVGMKKYKVMYAGRSKTAHDYQNHIANNLNLFLNHGGVETLVSFLTYSNQYSIKILSPFLETSEYP